MSRPDWNSPDCPEWANYLAMDKDGRWTWFEEKPRMKAVCWMPVFGTMQYVNLYDKPDWRHTLEERPARLVQEVPEGE